MHNNALNIISVLEPYVLVLGPHIRALEHLYGSRSYYAHYEKNWKYRDYMYLEACNFAYAILPLQFHSQFCNFAIFDFQNDYAILNVPDAFYDTLS